jgi:hypothetical protein
VSEIGARITDYVDNGQLKVVKKREVETEAPLTGPRSDLKRFVITRVIAKEDPIIIVALHFNFRGNIDARCLARRG